MNKRTIHFQSSICRNGEDIDVGVIATVYWSNGMDNNGWQSGYIVEDLEARNIEDKSPIPLSTFEIGELEDEAVKEYLK